MSTFLGICETEGCDQPATHIVLVRRRAWLYAACADHEAEKNEADDSVALPPAPEPEPQP